MSPAATPSLNTKGPNKALVSLQLASVFLRMFHPMVPKARLNVVAGIPDQVHLAHSLHALAGLQNESGDEQR